MVQWFFVVFLNQCQQPGPAANSRFRDNFNYAPLRLRSPCRYRSRTQASRYSQVKLTFASLILWDWIVLELEKLPSVVLLVVVVVGYHEGVGFYTSRNDERLPVLDFLRRTTEAGVGTGGVVAVTWQKRRFVEANFWQPLCLPRISSLEMIYRLRLVSVLAWFSFQDGNYLLTVRFDVANRSFTTTHIFFHTVILRKIWNVSGNA